MSEHSALMADSPHKQALGWLNVDVANLAAIEYTLHRWFSTAMIIVMVIFLGLFVKR